MNEEEKIEIVKQEYLEKVRFLEKLMDYQEDFFEYFLKIKIAFLTFIGVIISIVFANRDKFSNKFLLLLTAVLVVLFFLLTIELLLKYIDVTNAIKKQHRRTILAKIRHIAIVRPELNKYGQRSEELLIQEDFVEQQMLNEESLTDIIKYPRNILPVFLLTMWLLVFAGTPVLFLLEILKKL